MNAISLTITRLVLAVTAPRPRDQRGDVPGWVLVTVMTAGLVGVAGPQLDSMLTAALDSVHG
jgi:hypothetical protein